MCKNHTFKEITQQGAGIVVYQSVKCTCFMHAVNSKQIILQGVHGETFIIEVNPRFSNIQFTVCFPFINFNLK